MNRAEIFMTDTTHLGDQNIIRFLLYDLPNRGKRHSTDSGAVENVPSYNFLQGAPIELKFEN